MPSVSSPIGTTNSGIPLVSSAQRARMPGVPLQFDTLAALNTAITDERANITASSPIWSDRTEIRVSTEPSHINRVWNAGSQHARTIVLRPGLEVTLAADTNTVLTASGAAPSSGVGSDGDYAVDQGTGFTYAKTSGTWAQQPGRLSPPSVVDDLVTTSGTAALSANQGSILKTTLDGKLSGAAGAVGNTNIADASITSAKLYPLTSKQYLGRSSSGTGGVESVPAATLASDIGFNLAPVDLGTGTTGSLTYAANGNRVNFWSGTSAALFTIDTSTGTPPRGTMWIVENAGSANFTVTAALEGSGFTKTIGPGIVGSYQLGQSGTLRATTPLASNASVPVAVSGGTSVGSTLTATIGVGWTNTGGNWTRNGTNISGATSLTYTTVSGDTGTTVTYKSANIPYVPAGLNIADTTAPTLSTATIENSNTSAVVLTFNEPLNQVGSPPAASAFAVSSKTVSSVAWGTSTQVLVTVSAPFAVGGSHTISYTQPGSNQIQDPSGNLTASFSGQAITNNLSDVTAPTLVSAAVANATPTRVDLTWSEPMNSTPSAPSAFAITGGSHTPTAHTYVDSTHTYLTVPTYASGETTSLAYTQPGTNKMQDLAGNLLANFSGTSITDNVASFNRQDTFNRTDESPLANPSDGGTAWSNITQAGSGAMQLTSNAIKPVNTYATVISLLQHTIADATITVTIKTVGNGLIGIAFRSTDASNYMVFYFDVGAGQFKLQKRVTGTQTDIATAVTGTLAANDVLSIVISGTSLTGKKNGTTVISGTDSYATSTTKHGVYMSAGSANSGTIDDYSAI